MIITIRQLHTRDFFSQAPGKEGERMRFADKGIDD
jgi:hypothetical protein